MADDQDTTGTTPPTRNSSSLKRRRGVVRSSITRLGTRLRELEDARDLPTTPAHAEQLAAKLETLDADFKALHLQIIDSIENDDELDGEQTILDQHDDRMSEFQMRLSTLCSITARGPTPSGDTPEKNLLSRRLSRLERKLHSSHSAIAALTSDHPDVPLIKEYKEKIAEYKVESSQLCEEMLVMGLPDEDDLFLLHTRLDDQLFQCSHLIRKLLTECDTTTAITPSTGVKLPKLDVPTFDGNLLNWTLFWEQFCVAVHDRKGISDTEKLVYLRHALKDGTAKTIIEGLTRSGEHYVEAVESLKSRFDRPRLIHQTHVRCILESPSLREGSGKELRKLYDTIQQHIRALKSMGHEPSPSFITSVIELKLDTNTMFEWQRHSQSQNDVPHFQELLDFIDRRAQASEVSRSHLPHKTKNEGPPFQKKPQPKQVPAFPSTTTNLQSNCVLCKTEKHPLYACSKFKEMSHDDKRNVIKVNKMCMNCLTPGHQFKSCKSIHRCKRCQKPHHTMLHIDDATASTSDHISTNTAIKLKSNCLLMTCRVIFTSSNGLSVEARCLLDNGSSASFISERVAQCLRLPRHFQSICVSGITGMSNNGPGRHVSRLSVSPVNDSQRRFDITAIIVPRVTCDLPTQPINIKSNWDHLSGLSLADPNFGIPGQIDALLGVDIFVEALLPGRRSGCAGSPVAFETCFGWALAGSVEDVTPSSQVNSYHVSLSSTDDILLKFWEIEEAPSKGASLSLDERTVLRHFQDTYSRNEEGRFIVSLPRKPKAEAIGESRSQAVRRFLTLERNLKTKGIFDQVDCIMNEYLSLEHAEPVPHDSLDKPVNEVFYMPMHVVFKESSTTTKIRPVFDASAKSATGVSLNDILMVGPTVHSTLVDVLLRFRLNKVALTTDVSKMYRAIELTETDRDLHRFVWRSNQSDNIIDYRMKRVTFGVSASSFAANMSMKQNASDWAHEYPLAAKAVEQSFYVDDGLTGANSVDEAIKLQGELQALFARGGFHLHKWNSSHSTVIQSIDPELRDALKTHPITDTTISYTKTLGIEWNPEFDHFRITLNSPKLIEDHTKRTLVADIAKVFDVMGWVSPAIIKVKILLQRLWEARIGWDESVPSHLLDTWMRWRSELPLLSEIHINRYYFSDSERIVSLQLHGFSDASEDAYAAIVYLRSIDNCGCISLSIVIAKSRVAPIKRLTIPRLELCGAQLLAQLLHHLKDIFDMSLHDIYAWTDSTIVLNWLRDSPRRFKTYVGNRVSSIVNHIPSACWRHVSGSENPADIASRGLFPSELIHSSLWWKGPSWLYQSEDCWPNSAIELCYDETEMDELKITAHAISVAFIQTPVIPTNKYSNFSKLIRVTGWIFKFVNNCRASAQSHSSHHAKYLNVGSILIAERYWFRLSQSNCFSIDIISLKRKGELPNNSRLIQLRPFLDEYEILRVGGRIHKSDLSFAQRHPIILDGKDDVTQLIIESEHRRLSHAGPTLLIASLIYRFHVVSVKRVVHSIVKKCVTCRRQCIKPDNQLMGQLPLERVKPDLVFQNVGIDYAGPVYIKYGYVRKPTIVKAYICIFVSLSVKAVHIELVSDLTTEAFIACLRRFISRRGYPKLIWSDNGSNFVGANRELRELFEFLRQEETQDHITQFCITNRIEWRFIPGRSPHFGGIWEAAVKSTKSHLKKILSNVKLTYEEFSTVLSQIEACLNSRPLTPLNSTSEGIEVLTPGHFLIGRPIMALPDCTPSKPFHLLKRWQLCQTLVSHFWKRWSSEYISTLNRSNKWTSTRRNLTTGDIVLLREDNVIPTQWPLAKVIQTHPGDDGLVTVVTLKTSKGIYKRPINKVVVLLPID